MQEDVFLLVKEDKMLFLVELNVLEDKMLFLEEFELLEDKDVFFVLAKLFNCSMAAYQSCVEVLHWQPFFCQM